MKKIIAISLVGIAALSFSSCTCPACGGSGLQVRTSSGWAACPGGPQAGSGHETRACLPCKGSGIQGLRGAGEILDMGTRTADTVDRLSH